MALSFSDEDLEEVYRCSKEELKARQNLLKKKVSLNTYANYKHSSDYITDRMKVTDNTKDERKMLETELHKALYSEGHVKEDACRK